MDGLDDDNAETRITNPCIKTQTRENQCLLLFDSIPRNDCLYTTSARMSTEYHVKYLL
jgi:hypothetical protein